MKPRRITRDNRITFSEYLKKEEKSTATIEKYDRDIRHFSEFAERRDIDRQLVLEYKERLVETYAVSSANSMLAALNVFLKYMGWADLCVKQYKTQRHVFRPEKKNLSKAEYVSLVRSAKRIGNYRLGLIMETICATGIRVSELRYITMKAVMDGETTVSCKGKTRTVFIVSALRKKLLRYAKKNGIVEGSVFVTKGGKPVDRSNIWREMKKLCKPSGISTEKVFPHNLRHVFARVFYKAEKDIAQLADILGHSSINTTRIYIMSTGEEHKRRMEAMRLIL